MSNFSRWDDPAGTAYIEFSRGARGALARNILWGTINGEPVNEGMGLNVSAFGTLDPRELRILASILVAEADRIDSE